jgi:hypothetical protein
MDELARTLAEIAAIGNADTDPMLLLAKEEIRTLVELLSPDGILVLRDLLRVWLRRAPPPNRGRRTRE